MKRKIDIGCGRDKDDGYIGLDIVDLEAVDVVHDLNEFPYPFQDGRFEEVKASHVLEHVDDLVAVLDELHRICRDGAKIRIEAPYFTSRAAFTDPTHQVFFGYDSFNYFTENGVYSFYSEKEFEIKDRRIVLGSYPLKSVFERLINRFPEIHEHSFTRSIFPTANLHVTLKVSR